MKKRKYLLLTLIVSLLCINKVSAEECLMKIINDFEEVENRYKVDYRYNVERQSYTLIFNYAPNNIYDYRIYEVKGSNHEQEKVENIDCEQISETTKECHGFKIGTYRYEIYGKNNECEQTVRGIEIEVKELQNYSNDPLCEGIEEFVLCQKDYYKEMDYETFVSRVNTYKKTKQEKIEEEIKKQEEQKPSTTKKINSYIEENLVQIIVVIIFIILLTISILVEYKITRKSRRLE